MQVIQQIERQAANFLAWAKRPQVQRVGFAGAALLFVGGIYWSWQSVDLDMDRVRFGYLWLLAGVAVPVIILTNILELYYSAQLVGASLSFKRCAKVSILASAANLLPLPAGPMMRAAAVADGGGSMRGGAVAVLYPALVWLAIGLLFSATAMVMLGQALWGGMFAASGLTLLGLCFAIVARSSMSGKASRQVFVVKATGAAADTLAIYLTLLFIGDTPQLVQALGLSASGPLGSAVSVVPAGLGVREAASSALGLIVGLSAAQAFLAPSLYRIAYLCVLAVLCPFMMKADTPAPGSRNDSSDR